MRAFLREVFSEQNDGGGSFGSFSRVASGIALIAYIGWVTWIVLHGKPIPGLWNGCMFIGTLYGIRKFPDILAAMRGVSRNDQDHDHHA